MSTRAARPSPTEPVEQHRAGTAPERLALLLASALLVVVPALGWWDLELAARPMLAVGFVMVAPGVPWAIALFPRRRSLWLGLSAAISISLVLLLSVTQLIVDLWRPQWAASVLAVLGALGVTPAIRAIVRSRDGGSERPPEPDRRLIPRLLALVTLSAALLLWWWASRVVDLDSADVYGLVQVLPWQYLLALALVVATAAAALLARRGRGRVDHLILAGSAIVAVTIVYGFVAVADGTPAVATSYVHVGFVEYIGRTGQVLEGYDARFSWPGFFAAAAALLAFAGLDSALPLLVAYPIVLTTLLLAPLYTLGRAVTGSSRTAWLGIFLFIGANWVQQDYFAPQSVALLLYLVVVGTVLQLTVEARLPELSGGPLARAWSALRRTPGRPDGYSAGRIVLIELVLLLIGAGMVVSHQLTPVALIVALALLSLCGATRLRTLWLGIGVVFAAWFAFGAMDWWQGHLSILVDGFGQAATAIESGVTERIQGDPDYAAMQRLRIAWSGAIALLGLAGWLLVPDRVMRTAAATLVVAPILLVAGQSYGGEIVLRVFLFAAPVLSVLGAVLLARLLGLDVAARWRAVRSRSAAPTTAARAWRRRAGAVLAGTALTAVLLAATLLGTTTRGLNVAFERTPADVAEAAAVVLAEAPTGSTVRPLATEATLRIARVGELYHPATPACERTPFECLLQQDPDYVFLTSTRENYERFINGAHRGWFASIAQLLEISGRYRVIYEREHVIVLERIRSDSDDGLAGGG